MFAMKLSSRPCKRKLVTTRFFIFFIIPDMSSVCSSCLSSCNQKFVRVNTHTPMIFNLLIYLEKIFFDMFIILFIFGFVVQTSTKKKHIKGYFETKRHDYELQWWGWGCMVSIQLIRLIEN